MTWQKQYYKKSESKYHNEPVTVDGSEIRLEKRNEAFQLSQTYGEGWRDFKPPIPCQV